MTAGSTWRTERRHSLRVTAALALPGGILVLADRPAWLVYAVFGAFVGMYGRGSRGRARTVQQLRAALLLGTAVGVGALPAWAAVPASVVVAAVAAFAIVGSLAADRWLLQPAGPFFPIFALGAVALGPVDPARPDQALAVWALAAACAIGLGVRRGGAAGAVAPAGVLEWAAAVHALRYATAVGGAGAVSLAVGMANPNWAMAAAAVPLAAIDVGRPAGWELRAVLIRAGHRLAGTLLGLAATAAVLLADPPAWILATVAIALLYPTEVFMARHYGVAIGFFPPLVMVITGLGAPAPAGQMLTARVVDTVIGLIAGIAVAVAIRGGAAGPRRAAPAQARVRPARPVRA